MGERDGRYGGRNVQRISSGRRPGDELYLSDEYHYRYTRVNTDKEVFVVICRIGVLFLFWCLPARVHPWLMLTGQLFRLYKLLDNAGVRRSILLYGSMIYLECSVIS